MRILIVGNCHIHQIAESLEFMLAEKVDTLRDPALILNDAAKVEHAISQIEGAEIVGVISSFYNDLIRLCPNHKEKYRLIPHVRSSAFHPDIIEIYRGEKRLVSCMEVCHSRIVAYSYLYGLAETEVQALFSKKVFSALSYFDVWRYDMEWASYQSRVTGWDVERLYNKWRLAGCFVYTPNHPKLFVLADLALEFAQINKLNIKFGRAADLLIDRAAAHSIWPVYPAISELFDVFGSYYFKPVTKGRNISEHKDVAIDLAAFIEKSYISYREQNFSVTDLDDIESYRYHSFFARNDIRQNRSGHPYLHLPEMCFWKKSVANRSIEDVEPFILAKFRIKCTDKIATAGSCFAQHISKAISNHGFDFLVTETAPRDLSADQALAEHYGIYSARYGNIYTTTQLLQLFNRAYDEFSPASLYIERNDGRYVDPFRPYIFPQGLSTAEEVVSSLDEHLACVRAMFENLDVFIFTLGLTEGWRDTRDGSVYPIAPSLITSKASSDSFSYFNMGVSDIVNDLTEFRRKLKSVNPFARIILTVSPVPMVATYEFRHVLVSTTYSKSALRAAADEMERKFDDVMYFPSYEIITGNFTRGQYFEEDLRTVKEGGVDKVMSIFVKYCLDGQSYNKARASSRIVCDEENLAK